MEAKPIGFRPTPELRRKLEDAARQNGRSLAQEINSRIELSLAKELWTIARDLEDGRN